jgi:hypothetical protein
MPYDLALVTRVDKASLSEEMLASLGNVDYIFEMYGNDIQFENGLLLETTSSPKLVQSVIKGLLTDEGSHAEDVEYGSTLNALIGSKITSSTYANLVDSVVRFIGHYDDINSDNDSSDEYIDVFEKMDVTPDPTDPRRLFVRIQMTSESGTTINVAVLVGE